MFTCHRVQCGRARLVIGDETWTSLVAESADQQWTIVQGLESGVTYEVKVIVAGDDVYCQETQTAARRVHIDVKRGFIRSLIL